MKGATAALLFEMRLHQLTSSLAPVAKAIKCLEALDSTLADVYVYWLAIMASYSDLFKSNDEDLNLPSDVISNIRRLVNARYREMIEGEGKEMYLATFFLSPGASFSIHFTRHKVLT